MDRWMTKAVRMIREMRRSFGSMIPLRVVFSGAVQKGSPRRMLD